MTNSATRMATTEEIRAHFPALRRQHHGFSVAYFDGPGGTQVPRSVGDAVSDYLYHHNANTHWAYPTSAETDEIIADSRQALADLLNSDPSEIAFGANMTTLTFHLARALGRAWEPGDEVVVTELDHHANIAPWQALVKERGLVVRQIPVDVESGQLELGELSHLLSARTRLVAIGGASNALGTVNDLKRAITLAHAAGALTFVDAVHLAPHSLINVRTLDCDFLACSAYKFYGPHVGVLYGKGKLLAALDVPKLLPAPNTAPDRLETGTQNHEGIAGAAAAVNFLASLAEGETRRERLTTAFGELHRRGQELTTRLWEGLAAISGVRLYGPAPSAPRTPTVAFTVAGHSAEEVARHLAARGVFVSHGNFYAMTVVERLDAAGQGLVRAGCACYTTPEEVERLIDGVRELV